MFPVRFPPFADRGPVANGGACVPVLFSSPASSVDGRPSASFSFKFDITPILTLQIDAMDGFKSVRLYSSLNLAKMIMQYVKVLFPLENLGEFRPQRVEQITLLARFERWRSTRF